MPRRSLCRRVRTGHSVSCPRRRGDAPTGAAATPPPPRVAPRACLRRTLATETLARSDRRRWLHVPSTKRSPAMASFPQQQPALPRPERSRCARARRVAPTVLRGARGGRHVHRRLRRGRRPAGPFGRARRARQALGLRRGALHLLGSQPTAPTPPPRRHLASFPPARTPAVAPMSVASPGARARGLCGRALARLLRRLRGGRRGAARWWWRRRASRGWHRGRTSHGAARPCRLPPAARRAAPCFASRRLLPLLGFRGLGRFRKPKPPKPPGVWTP